MKKPVIRITLYLVLAVSAWFGWRAYRAGRNLVTLNVRNAPLREVVRSIERQTWEIIATHKDVDGAVTLKVRDARLEDVLNIIAEQVSCRWTAMYPLYTTGQSLDRFKKSVRGELIAADHGWTNLHTRPFGFRGGMFADTLRAENDRVTVNLQDKDLLIATMALGRYAQAQIVPEDGTAGTVSVKVQDAPMSEAVKQLARQTRRKWTQYYALIGGGFRPPRRDLTGDGTNTPPGEMTNMFRPFEEPPPEVVEARRKQFEATLETMTPEEREKAQAERQRMEQLRAEMANLTPEQRRERMEQMMNSPEGQERRARMEAQMQSRMANSIKNLTPEQRVERDKRFQEMRRNGGPFGGRGPGGPPPR